MKKSDCKYIKDLKVKKSGYNRSGIITICKCENYIFDKGNNRILFGIPEFNCDKCKFYERKK